MSTNDDVILEAAFDEAAIIKYHWLGLLPVCLFVVTIPIVIVIAIVYALLLPRIVASWSATLTTRSLLVRKGVLNKVEKTIPLEKITDLSMAEGPVMRFVGLKRIGVETAGQSGASGASLVRLLGVTDPDAFRDCVLAQRDRMSEGAGATMPASMSATVPAGASGSELRAIVESLHRIEAALDRMAGSPDERG